MPDEPLLELLSTADAARYLGLHRQTVKRHVYTVKDLVPDAIVADRLLFTRATLDEFQARRGPAWGGRPLKDPARGPIRPRPKKHPNGGSLA
jgi:hypothetical protein